MAKSPTQLELFKAPPRHFGGRLLLGRRKSLRPLSRNEAIHLVLRSLWTKGEHSFRKPQHRAAIERIIRSTAKKFGVKIYRQSINSNHLHLVVRPPDRATYAGFVRVISGAIASQVMRGQSFEQFRRAVCAQDENHSSMASVSPSRARFSSSNKISGQLPEPQGKGQKFFQFRPFTRVLHWGRDYRTCCRYVVQNTLEAIGFVLYKERKDAYTKWVLASLAGTVLIQV